MPGATESKFAKVSGMDKTGAFKKALSARKVAEAGYNGMLKGKLNVTVLPLGQKVATAVMPFIPKKMILRMIRKMQEVE